MYRYIFFDLDGTLTDSKEGIFNCLRYAFEKLGEPVPPESTLMKFIGPPLQDSFVRFCGFDSEKAIRGIELFRERYAPIGKFENAAAPGMADLCRRLKERGYVLALASSKPEEMCVPICEKFGFAPSMETITGSPPVGDWEKTDVIRETMRRLGLTEADKPSILMVGDRKFDVLGARDCGIDCVGVEFFGYALPGELAESVSFFVLRAGVAVRLLYTTKRKKSMHRKSDKRRIPRIFHGEDFPPRQCCARYVVRNAGLGLLEKVSR